MISLLFLSILSFTVFSLIFLIQLFTISFFNSTEFTLVTFLFYNIFILSTNFYASYWCFNKIFSSINSTNLNYSCIFIFYHLSSNAFILCDFIRNIIFSSYMPSSTNATNIKKICDCQNFLYSSSLNTSIGLFPFWFTGYPQ